MGISHPIKIASKTERVINSVYTNISVNSVGFVFMVGSTLTLSIPERLKKELKEIKGVNWSEETRVFLKERIKRLKALKKLDELTKNSEITDEEILELSRKINAGIAKWHEQKLPAK